MPPDNKTSTIMGRRSIGALALVVGIFGLSAPALTQTTSGNGSIQEDTMSNIEIAKTYIKAVQTGDQATLANIISPEVIWHQPGSNQFSGVHKGMAAVGPMLGRMMEVSKGTFNITKADHFMANGDWVAITIEFSGEANSIRMSQPGIDMIRIANGKIVEVRLFSSNQEEEDRFWGK